MRQKNYYRFTKILILLTVIMFFLLAVESWIYYSEKITELPFKIMMVIQNIVSGFAFKPDIKLKDAYDFYVKNKETTNSLFLTFITYAYGIAMFGANFCTLTWLYKLLEKVFRITYIGSLFNKYKNHIIIFGYNECTKMLLKNKDSNHDDKSRCIHIICSEELDTSELYQLRKNRVFLHKFDAIKADKESFEYFIGKIKAENANSILLFEDSDMNNLSVFRELCEVSKGWNNNKYPKAYVRCEDRKIEELIEKIYDKNKETNDKNNISKFDIETVSIPELQIQNMFQNKNLHSLYFDNDTTNDNVNVLIVGFGKLGKEALVQTMNYGVLNSTNKINVDIIEYKMKDKTNLFAEMFSANNYNRFDNGELLNDKGNALFLKEGKKPISFKMKESIVDEPMTINLIDMDVRNGLFKDLIDMGSPFIKDEENKDNHYTYVIIAIDNSDVAIYCAREIAYSIHNNKKNKMPVMLRLDSDKLVRTFINDEKNQEGIFEFVDLIKTPAEVISLTSLIDNGLDKESKKFNLEYDCLSTQKFSLGSTNEDENDEIKWRELDYYKRPVNKSLALYYEYVFKNYYEKKMNENDKNNLNRAIEELDSKFGVIKKEVLDKIASCRTETEKKDLKKELENKLNESFDKQIQEYDDLLEHCKSEHRRWCYCFISRGWEYSNKKDPSWHKHNCLLPFEKLREDANTKNTIKYDMMKMLLYKKNKGILHD